MKKFRFNKKRPANPANLANGPEKQGGINTNSLRTIANDSDEIESFAEIRKSVASNIFSKNSKIRNIRNIRKTEGLRLRIEPIETCLHGGCCWFLDAPGDTRPMCKAEKKPIFDISACPKGKWYFCVRHKSLLESAKSFTE